MDGQDQRDHLEASAVTFRYGVRTWRDPQSIARVAGVFAQRSLIPSLFDCVDEADQLLIRVEAQLTSEAVAELIRRKLEALVIVDQPISFERKE